MATYVLKVINPTAIGAAATTILAATSGKKCVIHELIVGSVDASNDATVTVGIIPSGASTAVLVLSGCTVTKAKALPIFADGSALGKLTLDGATNVTLVGTLQLTASTSGDLVAFGSYMEVTE